MRRGGGLLALLLLALALGGLLERAAQSFALDADSRPESSSPWEPGRYVMIGVILYDKQLGQEVYVYNGTGFATATPNAPLPTAPPRPTNTPLPPPPTLTPTPSATPATFPTPTPEVVLPTATPRDGPGGTKTCELKVNTNTRIRSAPSLSGQLLGTWAIGEPREVVEFALADNYLWTRHSAGWSAVKIHPATPPESGWWADGFEGNRELCVDVPGWPEGLAPPPAIARAPMVGWTVTPGASRDALLLAGRELQAAGITPTATVTSDHETASVLHDNGWYVVVRLWTVFPGDCPDMSLPPATSARLRVAYLARQHAGARFDAAQLSNECGWPSAAYLRDWLIAAVGECDARGWTCIPVTFNTGAPELTWLATLRPALRLMRAHHHLLGYNAYPYDAVRMLCEDSDFTSYTTFRWRRFADYVPAGELPPIYLTEAARGDGAREPALEDVVCFADAIKGDVIGLCYWYAGVPLAPWQAAAWSPGQLLIGARALAAS